jgi:hypothetical protein
MTPTRILGAALALAAACSSPPAATPGSGGTSSDASTDVTRAAVGDTVQIVLGRSASIDGGRLLLTFRSHGPDSRCPANVVCVWMGDVAVRLAARAGATSAEADLHTGLEPRTLSVGGYVVKLVGLLPYPGTPDASDLNSPRIAIVHVTRAG